LGSQGIPEFLGPKPDWFDSYASSYAVGPQIGVNSGKRIFSYVYGACSIYRKEPLIRLFSKGFTPVSSGRKEGKLSSGDDVEWCALMQLLGYQVTYSEKMLFYHRLSLDRLNWEYYLRLKQGISSNSGLLSSYELYFSNPSGSRIWFVKKYGNKLIRSVLLYFKYLIRWKRNPSLPKDQLSFVILKSQMWAYLNQRTVAFSHIKQLKQYFGS
jgi:hypothetical protein